MEAWCRRAMAKHQYLKPWEWEQVGIPPHQFSTRLIRFDGNTTGGLIMSVIRMIRFTRWKTKSFNQGIICLRGVFFFSLYLHLDQANLRNIWPNSIHLHWPLQSCHSVVTITVPTRPGESHHQSQHFCEGKNIFKKLHLYSCALIKANPWTQSCTVCLNWFSWEFRALKLNLNFG